jgi:hypothetical protein
MDSRYVDQVVDRLPLLCHADIVIARGFRRQVKICRLPAEAHRDRLSR